MTTAAIICDFIRRWQRRDDDAENDNDDDDDGDDDDDLDAFTDEYFGSTSLASLHGGLYPQFT